MRRARHLVLACSLGLVGIMMARPEAWAAPDAPAGANTDASSSRPRKPTVRIMGNGVEMDLPLDWDESFSIQVPTAQTLDDAPVVMPSASASVMPAVSTLQPSPSPEPSPSPTPEPSPTAPPTPEPTPDPTPSPTPSPTPIATTEPTPAPSATPMASESPAVALPSPEASAEVLPRVPSPAPRINPSPRVEDPLHDERKKARILSAENRFREALQLLDTTLAEHDEDAGLHAQRGSVLLMMGDLPGARRAWLRALARDPGNQEVREFLGWLDRRNRLPNDRR